MAIVTLTDILKFLELSADDSYGTVSSIHTGIEQAIKRYCNRGLESTSYKDKYSGKQKYIVLKDYPVTVITKVMKGETSPMYITNTNRFTSAVVSVTEAGVVLRYNGAVTAGDYTFATNTTLATLATAVNAAGSGWVAVIQNPDYNPVLSTELLPAFGVNAIYNRYASLYMPFEDFPYLHVDDVRGILRNESDLVGEFENLYVYYTAGYTTIPNDLIFAVKMWVKSVYTKHQDNGVGLQDYSIAGMRKSYTEIPPEVEIILQRYKRLLL